MSKVIIYNGKIDVNLQENCIILLEDENKKVSAKEDYWGRLELQSISKRKNFDFEIKYYENRFGQFILRKILRIL